MRLLFFIFASAHLFAADVGIGVFGLFHPAQLVLQPLKGHPLSVETAGVRKVISTPFKIDLTTGPVQISEPAPFRLGVPGRIDRQYYGCLRITAINGVLVPVVYMSLEDATAAAVAAEMPADAPPSALAAMAVLARSFYSAPSSRHQGFEFCDTTHCQFNRGPARINSRALEATRQTEGLVLTYQGEPFAPLYSSSCGGRTRTLQQVGMPITGYPYFAVHCPACRRDAKTWERRLDAGTAGALLAQVSEPMRIQILRTLGTNAIPGNNYVATLEANQVVLKGRGEGHGVGLCQKGAIAMAIGGKSLTEILATWFPNTQIRAKSGPRYTW